MTSGSIRSLARCKTNPICLRKAPGSQGAEIDRRITVDDLLILTAIDSLHRERCLLWLPRCKTNPIFRCENALTHRSGTFRKALFRLDVVRRW